MTGGVIQVTVRGVPLDTLCDMLPVFEPVEQLVCLDVKDPQEVSLAVLSTAPTVTGLCQSHWIMSVPLVAMV